MAKPWRKGEFTSPAQVKSPRGPNSGYAAVGRAQKTVLRLLKTARGQIDGIIKMVEDDRYCMDISQQLTCAPPRR